MSSLVTPQVRKAEELPASSGTKSKQKRKRFFALYSLMKFALDSFTGIPAGNKNNIEVPRSDSLLA